MNFILPTFIIKDQYLKSTNVVHWALMGGIFSLGVPPYHYWFLSLIILSCLLRLIQVKPQKILTTFSIIFIFSLSHYVTSSYWIINTFIVVVDNYFFGNLIGGLTLLLIASSMAFVTAGVVTLSIHLAILLKFKNLLLIIVPLSWAISEHFRSYFLGGQPMHYIGYMLGNNDYLIQIASIFNVQIVSLFFVLIAMFFSRGGKSTLLGIIVLCLGYSFGIYRVENSVQGIPRELLHVRLVNANLTQIELINSLNSYKTVERYIELSKRVEGNNIPDLIIWPESTLQFYIEKGPKSFKNREYITNFLTPKQSLIAGGPRYSYNDKGKTQYHGSIFHLGSDGSIMGTYDKHILVPWGEYIPYRHLFPKEITNIFDIKDYTAGDGPLSLDYRNSFSILPLLCAEGHYPRLLSDHLTGQSFIIMIGNEAWLEGTTEPSQYFVNARFRAVESGLPVLLASNKGYLAIINNKGLVQKAIYENAANILDGTILIEPK